MCECCEISHIARMVMTMLRKFADLRFLVSKYKDTSMVFFFNLILCEVIMSKNVQIYINKKEMAYSRQNLIAAINSFLPYLTNPDLDNLFDRCTTLKEHRHQQEQQSRLEAKNLPHHIRHDT